MKALAIDAYEVPITSHVSRVHQVSKLGRAGISRKSSRNGAEYGFLFMRPDGAQVTKIGKLVENGLVRPQIDQVFSFDKTPAALAQSVSGRARGKIVRKGYRTSPSVSDV